MIYTYKDKKPDFEKASFIADSADIIGDVILGENSNIWFNTTIRGDMAEIRIGSSTNIQDGSILHVDHNAPCIIGDNVTVGHGAIIHAANIGSNCLIGMGSILLSNSEIGDESVVGAGSLVTEGKKFPPRSLIIGSPARKIKDLTDEDLEKIRKNAEVYVELGLESAKNSKIR